MGDQAQKLREMIKLRKNFPKEAKEKDEEKSPTPAPGIDSRVVAVTSGKGGVGKTNFTINLGITLAKAGKKVVIFDADLGLANIDVILGSIPKYTLVDLMERDLPIEKVMSEGPEGIGIISGASGIEGLMDMSPEKVEGLTRRFSEISRYADFILIDTGAGISKSVLSFVLAAQEVLVISTPEPTSITDAYAVIKAIGNQDRDKSIQLLINKVKDSKEGREVYHKLQRVGKEFLQMEIGLLGFVREDPSVVKAVYSQNPFAVQFPACHAAKDIEAAARKLVSKEADEIKEDQGFFQKVIGLFK
ncbi:MinD/ParA family protein [Isachenkonia alkalipeptolytica]|uniref:MinD/ParA family protein n=1 Tax=Isachenkonia alkalipeptolytica TaxID=2565777 RepID=A0AA43XJM9_9CLOT|nr:MinD/ParA family protein [Isachenkonia alkalipeptolytica]NBG87586.1 MinD/ParA family protein [Isachenkonia alkalipeptolytica]